MIEFKFEYDGKIDTMADRVTTAVTKKLAELTIRMYEKVIENVSGKLLQKQSGQLLSSIDLNFGFDGNTKVGEVLVSPATPKAWALEKGGEDFYTIIPTKTDLLHWFRDDKHHFAKEVLHPPSKEYAYLRTALEEIQGVALEELQEVVQAALNGTA